MSGFASRMLLLAALANWQAAPTRAGDVSQLYRTQAIVTGTGEANRRIGFEECFRDVLVKVSGDQRLLREAKVVAALPDAGSFVSSFRYRDRLEGISVHDEQGTHDRPHDLYCSFDRARIDAFLGELGRRPFLAERPPVTVFLSVRTANGKAFVLTRDGDESPYMRDSLRAAAEPLAMVVDLPRQADVAALATEFGSLDDAAVDTLADMAQRAGDAQLLAGRLLWSDADLGWIAEWRLERNARLHRWSLRGVGFDEAFRNAMNGTLQVVSGHGQPE